MIKRNTVYKLKEESRLYVWDDRTSLYIYRPRTLTVTSSGNHYVENEDKNKYIVAPGWRFITITDNGAEWVTEPERPVLTTENCPLK